MLSFVVIGLVAVISALLSFCQKPKINRPKTQFNLHTKMRIKTKKVNDEDTIV